MRAGIDIGARNVKVVIVKDREVVSKAIAPVGFSEIASAKSALDKALQDVSITKDQLECIVATGAGRKRIYKNPPINANYEVTEVLASALGATALTPTVRTVINVGAEQALAIRCEAGKVKDFVTNERCAAGAGTFIEVMSRTLEVPLEEFGPLSLKAKKPVPINAQCTVFAESEVVTLIAEGYAKEDIASAINSAIAERIGAMTRRIGIEKDVVLIGGMTKNVGFVKALEKDLGVNIIVPEFPEYTCAFGAAIAV